MSFSAQVDILKNKFAIRDKCYEENSITAFIYLKSTCCLFFIRTGMF